MKKRNIEYQSYSTNLLDSAPNYFDISKIEKNFSIINIGPHHPSTHGVLRLEVLVEW